MENDRQIIFNKKAARIYSPYELQQLADDVWKCGGGLNSSSDVQEWLERWHPPLEEMPLYINSEMLHERVIARWRLRLGK